MNPSAMPATRPAWCDERPRRRPVQHAMVCDPPYNTVCPGTPDHRCREIIPRHLERCRSCRQETGEATP